MQTFDLSRRRALLAAGATALISPAAWAQAYPARPVTVVATFPAGGAIDLPARLLAQALTALTGGNFLVQNIAGAGGMIGAAAVAKAPPDGYQLMLSNSALTIAQATYHAPQYDSVKNFDHIAMFASYATVLVAGPQAPARSLDDLIDLARRKPGAINIASSGNGTAPHLMVEFLKQRAGIDVQHVAYKGAAPAITDVLGGQVDYMATGLSALLPHIQSGRMKPLAVTTAKRSGSLPDVPTFAETLRDFEINVWLGLSGPAGMPAQTRSWLEGRVRQVMQMPEFRSGLDKAGLVPAYMNGADFTAVVARDLALYRDIAQKAKLVVE